MKFMTIDEVARELLLEVGIVTEHKLYRAIQLGIACMRGLNMDVSGVPKTIIVPINANQTINLPDDYIDYILVGFVDQNGIIRTMGLNNGLALPRTTDECGNLTDTRENLSTEVTGGYGNVTNSTFYGDHFRNGEPTGRFFGMGGGNNSYGYYKIDRENNFMLLNNVMANEIYLEYLAEPIAKNGAYQIHPFIVETVKQYINYKMINPNQKMEYIIELKKSKARYSNFNMQEMLSAERLSNKAAPRY
jgi:hypothetical protein